MHYRFLSCGTVFETGLREAASPWACRASTPTGTTRTCREDRRFRPDLLFVVHGRRFVQRWGERFATWRSAVWLLDEPYEVDDTAAWSQQFDHVFVNDAASLAAPPRPCTAGRLRAPLHHGRAGRAAFRVGFIGGANPSRERMLAGLARRGLLDYVVGGPGATRLASSASRPTFLPSAPRSSTATPRSC